MVVEKGIGGFCGGGEMMGNGYRNGNEEEMEEEEKE